MVNPTIWRTVGLLDTRPPGQRRTETKMEVKATRRPLCPTALELLCFLLTNTVLFHVVLNVHDVLNVHEVLNVHGADEGIH